MRELYASASPLGFVAGRKAIGDSWDIVRSVAPRLPAGTALTISVSGAFPEQAWAEAADRQLDMSRLSIRLRASGAGRSHPWSQDHFKSGHVGDESKALVPRRLYEGRGSDGEIYRPLLDELRKAAFTQSKLSWEGGDLQFVADPRNPVRTILIHGWAALTYWGDPLRPKEFSYVLATEFGADDFLDLSSLGPHADYLTAFLPHDNIALVSKPVQGTFASSAPLSPPSRRCTARKRRPG